jgi:hypothetical protein
MPGSDCRHFLGKFSVSRVKVSGKEKIIFKKMPSMALIGFLVLRTRISGIYTRRLSAASGPIFECFYAIVSQ